jgi:hypothetical protein
MNITQARRQAQDLVDALLATRASYRVVIDPRPTRRLGQCRFSQREIGLSRRFLEANEWGIIENTVRHEAAHAAVGPGYGHGAVWARQARAFGVRNPSSRETNPELRMAPAAVAIVCPTHGVIGGRSRMPKGYNRYTHNGCGDVVRFERTVR